MTILSYLRYKIGVVLCRRLHKVGVAPPCQYWRRGRGGRWRRPSRRRRVRPQSRVLAQMWERLGVIRVKMLRRAEVTSTSCRQKFLRRTTAIKLGWREVFLSRQCLEKYVKMYMDMRFRKANGNRKARGGKLSPRAA